MMDRLHIRRALRLIIIAGTTFALMYYGFEGVKAEHMLTSWLVLIGAIALGMGWAKVWPEPSRK